jgi:carboxyl-terminal processing protease
MSDKKADLIKNKNAIKRELQDEIVTRYYFSKGRLQNQLKEDDEVEEAIQLLNDTAKYNKILNSK